MEKYNLNDIDIIAESYEEQLNEGILNRVGNAISKGVANAKGTAAGVGSYIANAARSIGNIGKGIAAGVQNAHNANMGNNTTVQPQYYNKTNVKASAAEAKFNSLYNSIVQKTSENINSLVSAGYLKPEQADQIIKTLDDFIRSLIQQNQIELQQNQNNQNNQSNQQPGVDEQEEHECCEEKRKYFTKTFRK